MKIILSCIRVGFTNEMLSIGILLLSKSWNRQIGVNYLERMSLSSLPYSTLTNNNLKSAVTAAYCGAGITILRT